MRVAAIDIGSNSVRLLIADFSLGRDGASLLRAVVRAGEPCRLGRGLDRGGALDPGTAERAAHLVERFAERARGMGAGHTVVGATAALRQATNGNEVAAFVGARCGLPVRILSAEEEARLVYRAVLAGLGGGARRSSCVVFDLGGGSTEVVSGVGMVAGRWTSLAFGAVNLTERFLTTDPPGAAAVAALGEAVRAELMHVCALFPRRTPLLAGVGGTVTVLALLDRGLSSYEPSLIEGWMIPPARIELHVERLVHSDHQARRGVPGMGEGRADIVVAGAVVVRELVHRFPSSGLVCSTQGLRYGLARLAAQELAGADPRDPEVPR